MAPIASGGFTSRVFASHGSSSAIMWSTRFSKLRSSSSLKMLTYCFTPNSSPGLKPAGHLPSRKTCVISVNWRPPLSINR